MRGFWRQIRVFGEGGEDSGNGCGALTKGESILAMRVFGEKCEDLVRNVGFGR